MKRNKDLPPPLPATALFQPRIVRQAAEDTDPDQGAEASGADEQSAREEVTDYLNAFALAFGLREGRRWFDI